MNELLGGCFESSATSGVTRELLARGKIIPRYCTCDLSLRTPLSSYHYHNLNEMITEPNLLLKIIIIYLVSVNVFAFYSSRMRELIRLLLSNPIG
jgi:hypothetical protein